MIPFQAPPCYDPKTKRDCERRCAGCSINCPEWAEYEAYKAKKYIQQKKDRICADFAVRNIYRLRGRYKSSDKIKAVIAQR